MAQKSHLGVGAAVALVILMAFAGGAAANCSDASLACTAPSVIAAIQRALAKQGFDPGPIDGGYGRRTSAALARFLAARGVPNSAFLTREMTIALWGLEIDYVNATIEERLAFLERLGITDVSPDQVRDPEQVD